MRFHLLYASSVSACFELENTAPYYADAPYTVTVDRAPALEGVRTNVFSLFDLRPDTEYTVGIEDDTVTFRTRGETACLSVRDFGARGDVATDDTKAIQNAILACPDGGRVKIPAGTYRVRPLMLRSNITLELRKGAVLRGDTHEENYPVLPGDIRDADTGRNMIISMWEGDPRPSHQSLLSAYYAHNVDIIGQGIIDGNAQNSSWWQNVKERHIARPRLVYLHECENITFHGVTGRNSPAWNFHPFLCKHIGFYDTAVEAPKDSPNTDGTDPEACDDVRYIGMRFAVGDDAIAIKSGKMYFGMKYKIPATNTVIRNCLMEYAHGAVVLGSEMAGGVRDLQVSQCLFSHTDRGVRIKTRRGRGKYSVVDGVEFENVRMDNVMCPLVVNMYYFCDPDGHTEFVSSKKVQPVDDTTPYLGALTFRDMECTDCEWAAGYFYGLPEQPVGSVTIENVHFTFKAGAKKGQPAMMEDCKEVARMGLYFNNVQSVHLKNVTMEGQKGKEVITEHVKEVTRE